MKPKIAFTGGGTAGHVVPNIALIEALKSYGWPLEYIGSKDGVEKGMMQQLHIPYHAVQSGKLRRYFSFKNFLDPVKILLGIVQSFFLLRKLKVDILFSKGGFVAFPVVVGAWLNKIPVIAHESDLTPGLANRLSLPFATKICVTFPGAKNHFKNPAKVAITGTPIRKSLFQGSKEKGLAWCGFQKDKPCLLIMGGSLGAQALNRCVREALDELCQTFQIIHLCGKGKVDERFSREGYRQLEYANEELADLMAAAVIVISRAGANSVYEILALGKPHILIPLSKQASRGDQIENAEYFKQQQISVVIQEEKLTPQTLTQAVQDVMVQKDEIISKISVLEIQSATEKIIDIILETLNVEAARAV